MNEKKKIQKLYIRVKKVWEKLGAENPHWSVLTVDQYRSESIEGTKEQFYASGRDQVDILKNVLIRNDRDPSRYSSILEFGCGVGRVTHWLGRSFDTVHSCDVSSHHLRLAKNNIAENDIRNVTFHHLTSIEDLSDLPPVDLVISYLVLQHNPPPIIETLIDHLLSILNPGGAALFQVPISIVDYRFDLKSYLKRSIKPNELEMHPLPMERILELIEGQNCQILDSYNDHVIEPSFGVSNVFLVEKR